MPSLFKEIFQQVFRRFVKDRGRFPTPAERDALQDIAQKEARKQMENIDPVFKGTPKMDPDRPFMGFKPKIVPKETEAEILARMKKQNKEAVERLKKKKEESREDFSIGGGVMKIIKALSEKSPLQRYKDYLASVKKRSIEGDMKSLAPEMAAITSGGVLVNRMLQRTLSDMKETDKEINLENFKQELENDPFYQERPELKDKVLEKYVETMFGEEKANGGRIGFSGGGAGLPAATGGQTVFIGPTLPEEEDEEEVTTPEEELEIGGRDPMEYMLNTGFQPIFPMPQMQRVPTEGGVGELREFLKSRGAQELGMGYNFPVGQSGILGVGVAPSGNVGATFLKRFQEGGPVDPDRRTFIKILGGLASIPILSKFVTPFKQAAPVVAETAKEVPAYFFKLVDKIRRLGDDAPGLTTVERESGKKYKNYEMVEDQTTGDIVIKKQKQGSTMVGDDMVEGTMSEEVLAYRTPKNTPEGRLPADYEEITVRPDFEGKMRDVEDGLDSMNEILEEVGEAQLKKAGGGLAYMLGE